MTDLATMSCLICRDERQDATELTAATASVMMLTDIMDADSLLSRTVSVSVGQFAVAQGEPEVNLGVAEKLIAEAARRGSELICLPEMWTCGFDFARNRGISGRFRDDIARVGEMARTHRIWINGSMPMPEPDGRLSNTSILFSPEGEQAGVYHKVHLFSLFKEHEHVAAGSELVDVDPPWGRTGLAVCYDLRFPELFLAYALRGVRVQLCPAAWPHPRLHHWRTLLRARAIENQFFMIAANQVGSERFGDTTATYCGHSAIIDPWGNTVVEAGEAEVLLTATIDLTVVDRIRQKMNLLADRRAGVYVNPSNQKGLSSGLLGSHT